MKHTAKKLEENIWLYRGWIIKRWDNNYLNDPEIRGFQYNTYLDMDEYRKGNMTDIADTLKDAKMYIDICEDREIKLGDFMDSNLTFNDLFRGVVK